MFELVFGPTVQLDALLKLSDNNRSFRLLAQPTAKPSLEMVLSSNTGLDVVIVGNDRESNLIQAAGTMIDFLE